MNQTKTTPKDFFLHLGALIALYASVVALINLVFTILNYVSPDALDTHLFSNVVATPISILIVLVPTLYIIGWFIKKDIALIPEKANLWIRRWRIFLTLFLTGATIVGDLIVLINIYLNGEITERFVYKVLAILIICGIVLTYYLLEKTYTHKAIQKALAGVGIIIVILSIIGGFVIVGSPAKQRALRFDNQRLSDLQSIQYQIVNYWQMKGKLPASLANLKDSISGTHVPMDPENKSAYEYMIKSDKTFEVCATFALKTIKNTVSPKYNTPIEIDNWNHEAGRACFTRTIDPELYPRINR